MNPFPTRIPYGQKPGCCKHRRMRGWWRWLCCSTGWRKPDRRLPWKCCRGWSRRRQRWVGCGSPLDNAATPRGDAPVAAAPRPSYCERRRIRGKSPEPFCKGESPPWFRRVLFEYSPVLGGREGGRERGTLMQISAKQRTTQYWLWHLNNVETQHLLYVLFPSMW